jgi:hypothetical protein
MGKMSPQATEGASSPLVQQSNPLPVSLRNPPRNRIGISADPRCGDAKHHDILPLKPERSDSVTFVQHVGMRCEAIDLNYRGGLVAVEICDVAGQWVLTTKRQAIQLASAEPRPENAFGHRHPLAKILRASRGERSCAQGLPERAARLVGWWLHDWGV